ncbi:hypothetical protein MTT09_06290 [Campylobacter concisus]|uniref:hypothetical protein n=1 Tax=Campylobacter concisus TaxID=199 RepID=UPI003D1F3188
MFYFSPRQSQGYEQPPIARIASDMLRSLSPARITLKTKIAFFSDPNFGFS